MSFDWDKMVEQKPPNECECGGTFELKECYRYNGLGYWNGKPIGHYDRMIFKCRKCNKTKQIKRYHQ